MKITDIYKLKINIISNTLKLIHYSEAHNLEAIIKDIQAYAKLMHIKLRKKIVVKQLENCLIDFCDNEKGAEETILNLYNVLIK